MANPATVSDVEARWRDLTSTELINAEAFLADAWAMLLARRPTLDADITAGTVSTENAIRVVTAMVIRIMRNPDGKLSETIDDYSYTRDRLISTGALHVTPEELADLTPSGYKRAKSVRLVAHGES